MKNYTIIQAIVFTPYEMKTGRIIIKSAPACISTGAMILLVLAGMGVNRVMDTVNIITSMMTNLNTLVEFVFIIEVYLLSGFISYKR